MDEISKLIRDRNRLMTAMAGIFLLWQGALMTRDIFVAAGFDGAERVAIWAEAGENVGMILWLIVTILLIVFMRRVRRAEAKDIINDELFRQIQGQAMRFGYKALIATLVALLALEAFVELEAEIVIRTFMMVAVAAPLGAFVVLTNQSGEEAE